MSSGARHRPLQSWASTVPKYKGGNSRPFHVFVGYLGAEQRSKRVLYSQDNGRMDMALQFRKKLHRTLLNRTYKEKLMRAINSLLHWGQAAVQTIVPPGTVMASEGEREFKTK
jgi:hypothetical protein